MEKEERMEINDINWHKKNLNNQNKYIEQIKKELSDQEKKLNELKKSACFYELQIKGAEDKNKTHFDRDRFMKKYRKNLMR